MPGSHSRLSASGASRWMNCTGSIALTAKMPSSPSSTYADEGTAAAFLAEMCLLQRWNAKVYENQWIRVNEDDCTLLANREEGAFQIDGEMMEHIQLYLDTVREGDGSRPLFVEKKVTIPGFDADTLGGTPDAAVAVPWGKLTVFDLKYGRGVVVEVEENTQLLVYLLGMEHTNVFSEFEVVIVQPRAPHPDGPVRRWTVTRKRLREFEREVRIKAKEALGPNGTLNAGDHCRWCGARGQCPAQEKKAKEVALTEFEPVEKPSLPFTDALPTARLAEIYRYKSAINTWFNDIGSLLRERLNAGEDVPGWKLVKGWGNRAWASDVDVAATLRKRGFRKKDIFVQTKPKLKSPAQVEKIKMKGFQSKKEQVEFVTTLTIRPATEANLVLDTDKRLAHRPATAEFDDLTKGTDND